ncbi:MAG TPA: DUF6285 domain-containing protein [Stellaceae bacterium]|nr:DUF6285 domain-containing protein [Stellaceae bacterium]
MMRDRPDGATLVKMAAARAAHEDRSLIERARAIAAREQAAGEAPLEACRGALVALYGEGELEALLRRLAADIRAGLFDAPGVRREAVHRLLWSMTRQKLAESNPDYLRDAGIV